MKRFLLLMSCWLLCAAQGQAEGIHDLLDAAARQPGYEVSVLSVRESDLQKDRATAALFPKIGLFGRFEKYNSPTNLRPMPPTEVNIQAGESLPFSREILRYGLSFDAPVYVRELYVLRQKARLLQEKADIGRRMGLIGRQASVISLNSALTYLEALGSAVDARRVSLGKTFEDMTLKVKTGRRPHATNCY